ncbi:MAG: type I secretion system permease/ATPase [Rhizobiales bacterium]|nr:type I secretion system permease/ATPase [Hyphomicrobiales bacterium]
MRPVSRNDRIHSSVTLALKDCRRVFLSVAVFSGVVNLLMLAGPLYMLQIYDRVLGSRSIPTLIALSVFLVGAYLFQGVLDAIRGRLVVRAANLLDRDLSSGVHNAVIHIATRSRNAEHANQPVRDLDQVRTFLNSAGPIAIVDLPWVPLFLGTCFLIHLWLGVLACIGGAILLGLTLLTERTSRLPSREVGRLAGIRSVLIEADRSNSETIVAMGMTKALSERWTNVNQSYLTAVGISSDIVGGYGSVSKVVRMLLQSAILGLGAFLVIKQELSAGAMIAASIMVGRALAPIETVIANWRTFLAARVGIRRLSDTLSRTEIEGQHMMLPAPSCNISIDNAVVAAPGASKATLSDINFSLVAGEALGIIGPSGGGKTSLARALVGIWPLMRGNVRMDGASIDQWDPRHLGHHIGFLSQSVELFDGTIAENIARMVVEPDSEQVLRAARVAGAHDMILRLPSGYDTRIGDGGMALSAGQRQRIALARALYGDPFLVLLDEPNSNLDSEGENALREAIRQAKVRGAIVIIIAHRSMILTACDKILYVANGTQRAFGPRDEVLRKLAAPVSLQPAELDLQAIGGAVSGRFR